MTTLKEARRSRVMTVRELAQAAGVAPSTVYLAENGRTTPRFAVIRKLAKALSVEPGEIAEFAEAIGSPGEEEDGNRRHSDSG